MSQATNPWLALSAPGVAALQPYVPGKPVEALERELGLTRTVKLASNENPLGPSPLALQAAQHVMQGLHLYPDDSGYRLKTRLAHFHQCQPDECILGAGSSDVLAMIAHAFLAPGVNAVYAAHSFAMYAIYTQASGADAKVAPALSADHADMPYGHDLDAMLALIDANTRVVFIANPNNPTGTWLSRTALEAFLQQVPSHVVVVLDEAYTQYVDNAAFPNGLQWIKDYQNLIVTRTFSKIYGIAGLRVGYGIAQQPLIDVIARVRAPFNVSLPALAAAEAALDDDDFLQRSVATNQQGMRQLQEGLAKLGLSAIPSVGNFLCIDMQQTAAPLYQQLLAKGVIVRPVANYQLPNHLRVTIGTAAENDFFLEQLAAVLQAC